MTIFTIVKVKFIFIIFTLLYSIFLSISIYFIYKTYVLTISHLNDFVYNSMTKDISKLNFNHPIQYYMDNIPSMTKINYVYGKLGIINYTDYIYNISSDMQSLNLILKQNNYLESKTSNLILADIIHQHSQLFYDCGEEVLKRVFKLSIPLFVSIFILCGTLIIENSSIVSIIT